jgi:hypothetical protein
MLGKFEDPILDVTNVVTFQSNNFIYIKVSGAYPHFCANSASHNMCFPYVLLAEFVQK